MATMNVDPTWEIGLTLADGDARHLGSYSAPAANEPDHARRLKTLRGLTHHEYVARVWTEDPGRFKIDPCRHSSGPRT